MQKKKKTKMPDVKTMTTIKESLLRFAINKE